MAQNLFFSHSSKDHEFALSISESLRANGINVWLDEWEIKAGDSLVQKIDEGISYADFFLILLSPNSLESKWVSLELDAAMVKRIEGTCRIIVVPYQVNDTDIPATLKPLKYVRLDEFDKGIKAIVDVCFDVSHKPPIGVPPIRVIAPKFNISASAMEILEFLNKNSKYGLIYDRMYFLSDIVEKLHMDQTEAEEAVDELKDKLFVNTEDYINTSSRIWPNERLFWATDNVFQDWDPQSDAQTLAQLLVSFKKDIVNVGEIETSLGWPLRRLNPAMTYLVQYGYAESSGGQGTEDCAYYYIQCTPKTRRYAKGLI